jgi:hypothetical protein
MNGGGGNNGNNEVVVDGASVVMPRQGGSIATSPSGDAVQELRVQTTMFDAAYGHSNGGVVSYAARSGANQLHGSFEDFYRKKAFNANTWLNNKRGLPRGNASRQFYSGAVGGPVFIPKLYDGRSRTFFFTSLRHEFSSNHSTYSARVPTAAERQGDFSHILNSQGGPLTIYMQITESKHSNVRMINGKREALISARGADRTHPVVAPEVGRPRRRFSTLAPAVQQRPSNTRQRPTTGGRPAPQVNVFTPHSGTTPPG